MMFDDEDGFVCVFKLQPNYFWEVRFGHGGWLGGEEKQKAQQQPIGVGRRRFTMRSASSSDGTVLKRTICIMRHCREVPPAPLVL
jgi:hypothetical protein